jgi:hypothetical protein
VYKYLFSASSKRRFFSSFKFSLFYSR